MCNMHNFRPCFLVKANEVIDKNHLYLEICQGVCYIETKELVTLPIPLPRTDNCFYTVTIVYEFM